MIDKIRAYLKASIKEVCPELKENNSAFYNADIPETIIDSSYQISLNNLVKTFRTDYNEREIIVIVSIFGHGYKQETLNYDKLLSRAICIEDTITNIQRFSGVETITNIISNGINADTLPGDDNAFKIDINLTLTQAYSRG